MSQAERAARVRQGHVRSYGLPPEACALCRQGDPLYGVDVPGQGIRILHEAHLAGRESER